MIQSTKINGISCYVHEADSRIDDIYAAFGPLKTIKQLAEASGADVAGNLPYAEYKITGRPLGRNVVDGKVVSQDSDKTLARDSLYMAADGTLHIGRPQANAKWSLQGSPPLLKDGQDVVDKGIERDQLGTDIWKNNAKHLRIAYGLKSPYELVIVRTLAEITLHETAAIMRTLGCPNAINGDGGGSATLYPADSGNGRKLGAALIIKKGDEPMTNPFKLIGDTNPELVIDPGHGGKDPGASGNGIVEKDMVLQISLYQFERFKQLGVPVALTRNTDITLEEDDRVALVANSGAKYCISNHNNSASAATAKGVEVIHSIYNNGQLARAIVDAIAAAGQIKRPTPVFCKEHPTIKGADYYYMHRRTGSVTTNIIEYGFLSNTEDAARIKDNWKVYAEAVVKAYCTYTGRAYTPPVVPDPPKVKQSSFSDVPAEHWADGVIAEAEEYGLVGGYPDGTFGPDKQPTRAEMAAAMVKLYKKLGGV